jgi:two-component system phosphate regulon sensor histidine kinase PhoR
VELLLKTMLWVDAFILILTIFFSYFLTKKILSPVEKFSIEQKKFVSNITHDLRTPLTVMKVGTEIFINGEYTSSEYKEFIHEQLEEINHLIKISEDLLFLLKSQEKIKRFKKINLSILLAREVKKMGIFSEQKKIKISSSIEKDIEFFGEETEIKRMVLNLLKNATDYNNTDGNIFVNLFTEKDKINLEISDDGIGISEKDQKYIFDRFYKADSSRGIKKNNSGLGLSIVKEIVLNHKGTIKLESELKKGTKIKILFSR